MATVEAKLIKDGFQVNPQLIADRLPGRSFDGVKKARQADEYKTVLDKVLCTLGLAPLGATPSQASPGTPPPVSPSASTCVTPCPLVTDGAAVMTRVDQPVELLSDHLEKAYRLGYFIFSQEQWLTLTDPGTNQQVRQQLVDDEYERWKSSVHVPHGRLQSTARKKRKTASAATRNQRRREQYARIQNLYRKNRTRCAEAVLSGDYEREPASIPFDEHETFWGTLFESDSVPDSRQPEPVCPPINALVEPISDQEVCDQRRQMSNSSPGLDGIRKRTLMSLSPDALANHYSLWLWLSLPPTAFLEGITYLLPKGADAHEAKDHRPITVSTSFSRLFHRIIAARMEREVPLSPRQKAFRRGDGLTDNVFILRSIVKDRTRQKRGVCVAFIDIAKAFDSVSHNSLLIAARRLGVPEMLIRYVENLYKGSHTTLAYNGHRSRRIRPRRGVRQGDPLSPLLFNFVTDYVLAQMPDVVGVRIGAINVNYIAFADDIAFIAGGPAGIKLLCETYETKMAEVGLSVNPKKSATLNIVIDGKKKRWLCDERPFLTMAGQQVPALNVSQSYAYLGTNMTASPASCEENVLPKLKTQLERLRKAPLKPQQRMFFLRVYVIPGLYHRLALDKITSGLLRQLDVAIRKSILQWLHLPHDTTTAYIHSDYKDGGLGIPCLKIQVPLLRKKRVESLIARASLGSDPLLRILVETSPYTKAEINKWCRGPTINGTVVSSKRMARKVLSDRLYASVDGSGLVHHQECQGISGWVANGTGLLTGRSYIHANQVRSATLHTSYRAARGFPNATGACDCCGRPETLAHILQTCERSAAPRDERHDSVNALCGKYLTDAGWTVINEPAIPTLAGIRRPDMLVFKQGVEAFILDTSIVGDNIFTDTAYQRKVDYYNDEDIVKFASRMACCSTDDVHLGAVILNWRGAISRKTSSLLVRLGVPRAQHEILSVRTLEYGYRTWSRFKNCTWVARGRLGAGRIVFR